MKALYNEIDQYCCAWLSNLMDAGLITPGKIDDRSITELTPDDVKGYERVHFFAGIAGWDYALNLAGWGDEPVWTGSCPCQPFSTASHGKGGGLKSDKHLLPHFGRLIYANRPRVVFGEQVSSARAWLDELSNAMEANEYSVRAVVLPAFSVGKDHERERIYFVCDTNRYSKPGCAVNAEAQGLSWGSGGPRNVVLKNGLPARMALRGFGNAIVPQVAAEVIAAYMETREINQELLAA